MSDTGWLQSKGLLYRLTDSPRPENRDEINVAMADGSRNDEARTRRASELLDKINGVSNFPLIAKVELVPHLDAGTGEVLIWMKNGKVIQISPDFNAINVWDDERHLKSGDYGSVHMKTLEEVDLGGST